jgi:hypothetical protein
LVSDPTPLVDAVADPKRREAETAIRQPEDTIVYVEGWLDLKFFKKHTSAPNLTFTNIGKDRGKSHILSTVSITEDSYGIVDMDHDFNSSEITSSRLVDTSKQCCLYGFVTQGEGNKEMIELAIATVRSVCRNLQGDPRISLIRNQMVDQLTYNGDRFGNFVSERTKARLYRGYLGSTQETRAPAEGECNWSDVVSSNGNPVRDRITDLMRQEYELFKQEYSEQISEAGVNEHDICDAIILLFKDQYVGYQDREGLVRSKVEYHVERLMIRKGNYDMTNYFLSELGLSSTP